MAPALKSMYQKEYTGFQEQRTVHDGMVFITPSEWSFSLKNVQITVCYIAKRVNQRWFLPYHIDRIGKQPFKKPGIRGTIWIGIKTDIFFWFLYLFVNFFTNELKFFYRNCVSQAGLSPVATRAPRSLSGHGSAYWDHWRFHLFLKLLPQRAVPLLWNYL